MRVSKNTDSGFQVVDQDYSSAHGAWAFRGNFSPFPAHLKVEVAKAKLRNRRGDVVAVSEPAVVRFTLTPVA